MALRERPTDAIGLCVFIVALYELQMPDTPFYAGKIRRCPGKPIFFRMFCGQNGVQWAESLQKNNIAGKTDKRARNFSEQLKFLCNVV